MKYLLSFIFLFRPLLNFGQTETLPKGLENDSSLIRLLENIPINARTEFISEYAKMDSAGRKSTFNFLNILTSLPTSSKKELIKNIDSNYSNVLELKSVFKKIVGSDYEVYIEFKPPNKLLNLSESIDFWVTKKSILKVGSKNIMSSAPLFSEWNVELKSKKLDSLLKLTKFTRNDLSSIKSKLEKANCISISNMDKIEIGYARSGMGKYSYLIFDKDLSNEETNNYNNNCEYIFYKKNIVLVYGGGAIGSQCFPDK